MSDDDNIVRIINMFKNELDISNEKVDVEKLSRHKEFTNLKDKDRKELLRIIKMGEDDSIAAYIICKNCSYSEKLIKRTMILNKMSKFSNSQSDNLSKYNYMRYDNTLPHTRDYICKNKDCKSNKDSTLKDAKWFRPNQNSYITYYVCCECGTVWNIA
jgi:DNA-directed RNA polymerase subunit M/transcription elongation factor TFIIS